MGPKNNILNLAFKILDPIAIIFPKKLDPTTKGKIK
jgi:hypothetical protein